MLHQPLPPATELIADARVIEAFDNCGEVSDAQGLADTIQKAIEVKPEGFPVEKVKSEFLCRSSEEISSAISEVNLGAFDLPINLVEGSARAWITASGDVLAPSLNKLDKLVKMPFGCGEQNMISLVPNIYVAKYLEDTEQDKPELMAKAKKFMKAGYERQESNYR